MRIWEVETSKPFVPEVGTAYENEGGGVYVCVVVGSVKPSVDRAWFQNVKSGWRCLCHYPRQYSNGQIDWSYSTDGSFQKLPRNFNHSMLNDSVFLA